MRSTSLANKNRKHAVLLVSSLLMSFTLSGCGGAQLTADEAAVEPCATFDKMTDSMSALDRSGVMMNAAEASKQFEDIASLDPRFGQFAQFLKEFQKRDQRVTQWAFTATCCFTAYR